MPLSIFRKLGLGDCKKTPITLQLADRSVKYPRGIVENVLVKVDKFIFPVDFVVLDMDEDQEVPMILGRPFLATGKALIDVEQGKLTLRVMDEQVTFNVYNNLGRPEDRKSCFAVKLVSELNHESVKGETGIDTLESILGAMDEWSDDEHDEEEKEKQNSEEFNIDEKEQDADSTQYPILEKFAFLDTDNTSPVIVYPSYTGDQEQQVLEMLREQKKLVGWKSADNEKNVLEIENPNSVQSQSQLDPTLMEMVKKEVFAQLKKFKIGACEIKCIYRKKAKRNKKKKGKREFLPGQKISLYNPHWNKFPGKWKSRWSGPFVITEILPNCAVELKARNGQTFKVSTHRLKHFGDAEDKDSANTINNSTRPS